MDKFLTIKGVKLNLEKAIKRVKMDIRDDWFQDPFHYEDILNLEYIKQKLLKYDGKADDYKAGKASHIDIPKPGFTSRYSTEIDIVDRVVYQAVVDVIADDLDKLHSNSIYSHRVNTARTDEKYFFRYAVDEWNKFLTDSALELSTDNNVLLLTDLSNFYESIGITDLVAVFDLFPPTDAIKAAEYKTCTTMLKSMLSTWCERNTKRGIPQNRDASSFIANIFLHPVDDAMLKAGYKYFRYMDDIRIVCKTKFEARLALKTLILELRRKGLNVNSKKTKILDYDNSGDRKEIELSSSNPDKKIEQIDALLKSKQARDIQIAVPMLRTKVLNLIDNDNTRDREFRFCINRLERIARNEKLAEKIDFNPITKRILNELVDQPWRSDTFARYLGSVNLLDEDIKIITDFLKDTAKNIYEWQSFYLWTLLTRHKVKSDELIAIARQNITNNNNIPNTAASCLYLGENGSANDKKFVAESFKGFSDHLTQRFALIAVKDMVYESVIKPHVQPTILENYKDSYKLMLAKYSGKYLAPLQALKPDEIYTELPDDIS